MKRHESLVPLSRDHHDALILAQLIKKNAPVYKGLPDTIATKASYAIKMFKDDLVKHFAKEEYLLRRVKYLHPDILALTDEIVAEHQELATLFISLENGPDQQTILNELGTKLELHIRKEERVLFPLIQQNCPQELLEEMAPLLQ